MVKKKKILWNSDFCKLSTGFGRNSKAVLKYLYDTDKYEIVEYACAPLTFKDKALEGVPWKAYGAIPEDPYIRHIISQDPHLESTVRYGSYFLDEIIEKERPDCFIGVNDFWAFHETYDKSWWNKINCALWITLDSLPIYKEAIINAHKIKNFWVWSKFAENEMKKLGFGHVKTLHGAFDVSDFKPLNNKNTLKKRFGLQDNYIFGFVFRNQGRKLIGTLLEAFSIYKTRNPESTAKLLLHTSWSEGWNIKDFIEEFKIDNKDIVTTHICRNCKKYELRPYSFDLTDCKFCGVQKAVITPHGGFGVSESEMNEIYNIIDFYIHPITSGGLEMPLVESLLAGTPISTVNYSCGEEFCEQNFVFPIEFSKYREMGSQFIKSQPDANDIASIMEYAEFDILPGERQKLSEDGRKWALKEFDLYNICKRIEDWIDSCPEASHDYIISEIEYNDKCAFNDSDISDEEWAIDLIKRVFGFEESKNNETVKKIIGNIANGESRLSIFEKSINIANAHNVNKQQNKQSNFFKDDNDINNICVIAPDTIEDKIIISKLFQELCNGEETVFLMGDDIDKDIFSQHGHFQMLPKNQNTNQVEWLSNIRNKEEKRRFKKIYFKNGNRFEEFTNKQ